VSAGATDRRGRLEADPFEVRFSQSGEATISRGGRPVTSVRGPAAAKLRARLDAAADEHARQLVLAKATGHYKH
jgi:hypothetical protein